MKTVAPSGTAILSMRPAATGLRTNRTRCAAGRSAVKRPRPVSSAGSSTRRIERPTQVRPEPLVGAVMRPRAPARAASPRAPGRGGIRRRHARLPADRRRPRRLRRRRERLPRPASVRRERLRLRAMRRGRPFGAANADTRLDDDAVLQGDTSQRHRDRIIAGAAAELIEAEARILRAAAADALRAATRPRRAWSSSCLRNNRRRR